jgi:hypothetical protein
MKLVPGNYGAKFSRRIENNVRAGLWTMYPIWREELGSTNKRRRKKKLRNEATRLQLLHPRYKSAVNVVATLNREAWFAEYGRAHISDRV